MAWTHVASYGGTGNKSAGVAATASVTASVGDILFVVCACDNSSSAGDIATGDVTGGSNTYTLRAVNESNGSNNSGASVGLFTCTVTSAMSATTVSFLPSAGTAAKNFRVYRFTGGSTIERGTYVAHNGDGTGTGTDTIVHPDPQVNDLVFGVVGVESEGIGATGDSDTTNGSWSTITVDGTTGSGGASNMSVLAQYKICTGTGSQSWTATWTNADWRNLIVAFLGFETHDADATRPVTATLTTALGATTKPVDAARSTTVTLAAALGATAKQVDTTRPVTATIAAAASVTKPVNATRPVTATTASAASVDKPVNASRAVTVTTTASATVAQARSVQIDAITWTMSYVPNTASPSDADTGSAIETASQVEPVNGDNDDDVVAVDEGHQGPTTADVLDSAVETQTLDVALASADTASATDAESLTVLGVETGTALDAGVAADATLSSSEAPTAVDASTIDVSVSSADTGTLVDAGTFGNFIFDDDLASATDDQDFTILGDDDGTFDDAVTDREFSESETGTFFDDLAAEGVPISSADTATATEGVSEISIDVDLDHAFADESEDDNVIIAVSDADTASALEAADAPPAELSADDTSTTTEGSPLEIERVEASNDPGAFFDGVPSISFSDDDTGSSTDDVELFPFTGADTGSAVDAATAPSATLSSAETFVWTDQFSTSPLANLLSSADTAHAVEGQSIVASLTAATDTGGATDEDQLVDSGTPRERTLQILADDRTYVIEPEVRVATIVAPDPYRPPVRPRRTVRRTLEIEAEDRTYLIERDDRTAVVLPPKPYKPPLVIKPAPSRVYVIPAERRQYVVVRDGRVD